MYMKKSAKIFIEIFVIALLISLLGDLVIGGVNNVFGPCPSSLGADYCTEVTIWGSMQLAIAAGVIVILTILYILYAKAED